MRRSRGQDQRAAECLPVDREGFEDATDASLMTNQSPTRPVHSSSNEFLSRSESPPISSPRGSETKTRNSSSGRAGHKSIFKFPVNFQVQMQFAGLQTGTSDCVWFCRFLRFPRNAVKKQSTRRFSSNHSGRGVEMPRPIGECCAFQAGMMTAGHTLT